MVAAWGSRNGESDDEEIDETTFMALEDSDAEDDDSEVKVKRSKHWYMDSACSRHMTGYRVEKLDTKEVILTAKKHRNVYKADIMGMPSTTLKCLSAIANDPLLWHKRLGHASLKQINKLLEKEMVLGLPKTKFKNDSVCGACVKGKQVRSSFTPKNQGDSEIEEYSQEQVEQPDPSVEQSASIQSGEQ
ncbi:hypothetical protein KY284_037250 [Solanum tuberosum]|nr:hypothetical protein KY284_037250 [Solanum tuberosum]